MVALKVRTGGSKSPRIISGDDSPLSEAILDRIKHDAYKINIVPTDPANYRSMREVYGLDANVNHFFTLLGKMFFTPYGKEFFTSLSKQIFTS